MKKGDYWSFADFGIVDAVDVIGDAGKKFFGVTSDITGQTFYVETPLQEMFAFHDQFERTEEITQTELANLFLLKTRVIMTVNFRKILKEKEIVERIKQLYPNQKEDLLSKKAYEERVEDIVSELLEGEERTIIGRHYANRNELGYCQFIDMEAEKDSSKPYDSRIRLIDPKRINWIIVDKIKYEKKN